ncbi:hypothetical protein VSWAT3_23869 [Vibrionales bacterium SWAT-3]|nr:hypothetical protein VSWAT3_23869 [Vibrionales bacterium SWAT-3]
MVERINYQGLPSIAGPYVHATKHNGTLYVSGLTAYGTSSQDQGIGEQTNEILSQIKQILEHEQRAVSDLIRARIYFVNLM